jgi:hypothetical protein
MGQITDQLNELRDDGIDYLRLRWAAMRLEAVDRVQAALSKAFGYLIFLVLLFIGLTFAMVAAALWLGELLGHLSIGFAIAGGTFIAAGLVVFFVRKRFARNTLVRYFIGIFFPTPTNDSKNDCGYGEK